MSEFKPDWKPSPVEQMQVDLSLALTKHVPGWPGATDEQLEAVARYVIEGQDASLTARIAELEKLKMVVMEYLAERDAPVPDYAMRCVLIDRLRTTLEASERGSQ